MSDWLRGSVDGLGSPGENVTIPAGVVDAEVAVGEDGAEISGIVGDRTAGIDSRS